VVDIVGNSPARRGCPVRRPQLVETGNGLGTGVETLAMVFR